ncbi:hypothetical protein N431DRAFT_348311 [Stipitochalara longipes BDJ]|nr:hypothetical protein N431DRAFT_348311 [Stipitochalara longipes BDJ]
MASDQIQDTADHVANIPSTKVGANLDETPEDYYEELESCAIPIHILSAAQKYFLNAVPVPGKIIAINLVSEEAPTIVDSSELQFLLQNIAIPEHVLLPLQEYFVNRRSNPKDYSKYVGIRFTQEDARLYDNVLSCCPRGCAHGLSRFTASEQEAEVPSESQREASIEDIHHESRGKHQGGASQSSESVSPALQPGSDDGNVESEADNSSVEDSSEHGAWILGVAEPG